MAPPVAASLSAFFALITAVSAATSSGYHNYTVGGAAGWLFNSTTNTAATNYSSWASAQTFNLGDFLIFNTNSNQTVVQTYNETLYQSCTADDSDNGTSIYDGGSSSFGEALTIPVPLTIVGNNYFFSDAGDGDGVQCRRGLAFQINVNRGQGLPPSLNQPPPPPYIEPPGPDAVQTPPSMVAVPPSGGASPTLANARVAIYGFAAALVLLRLRCRVCLESAKMGLISGIFFGMVFGVALMAGWQRMMTHRSAKRIAKAVDIKILGSLNRDDVKKICGDNFPEWITFPVYEQVKWLNKLLSKLWPFVADAATLVIRESVEPLLEEYRPPGITALKFSRLSLGTVPPKIEGIRVQSLKKGQITMDIDFKWGGDPDIILGVEALVASIPIQLKDLQIFTIIRVIFQLSEEIPCISAVVVALLAEPKPRIDYTLKAVGGSLTALPGVSDMIDDTVNTIVTDMLQWPHRIVVPLGGVPVDTSELELKPQGNLRVTVVRANDLKNMEMIGKSDPYVVVHIRPLFKVKTKVIDNNLNPVWNETFDLIAEDKETQSVIFEVFDEDIGQDKRLGIAKLPLIDLETETEKEVEVRLLPSLDTLKVKDKKDRGTLTVKIFYHVFNKKEQFAALEEEKKTLEERKKLKEQGIIGTTMDAVDGAASVVGSGVGMVGTGVVAGAGLVGTGIGAGAGLVGSGVTAGAGLVGSGVSAGAGLVGSGVSAGAGLVGSGVNAGAGLVGHGVSSGVGFMGSSLGAVGSGLSRAGKFMGRTITGQSGHKKSGSTTPINNIEEAGGGAKPLNLKSH